MKLKYLGTAAAEGVPGLFCNCEVCKKSRIAGGKNIRTRSQALVDGKILIDFPADTYWHVIQNNIDLSAIHTCIITHDHSDHLYPKDIENRRIGFAHNLEGVFTMYGTYPTYQKLANALIDCRMDCDNRVAAKRISPFQPFESEGYKITPLKADHDFHCDPVIYLIEHDGKAMLYANDTGIFPQETWDYLTKLPIKLDLVSFDCTCALFEGVVAGNHMNLGANKVVRQRLIDAGLTKKDTKYVVNHFSHNAIALYEEMLPIVEADGFILSYDGLEIEF